MSAFDVLLAEAKDELKNIKELLSEADDIIHKHKQPTNLSIRAGGSVLHDFYTGIERIFEEIADSVDKRIPSGERWHSELLNQMTLDLPKLRTPIITKQTAYVLSEYLRFRHLFRKKYGYTLEWQTIKRLLEKLPDIYVVVEKEILNAFSRRYTDETEGESPSTPKI